MFILIVALLIASVFYCIYIYKSEGFANTNGFATKLTNAFKSVNVDSQLNIFKNSQKEQLANRLPTFKNNIKEYGYSELIINDMYFDLRINDEDTYRKKILIGYKVMSGLINANTSDDEKKLLINIIKEEAKK